MNRTDAYQVEDDLASLPAVSQVETTGTREYEISIEVPRTFMSYREQGPGPAPDDRLAHSG